jgi:phospholipase C
LWLWNSIKGDQLDSMRRVLSLLLATVLPGSVVPFPTFARTGGWEGNFGDTSTPIKHLVVIFQENISFDHYFGTYPWAANPIGEPRFWPSHGTPLVNGFTPGLLYNNPNALNPANGDGAVNPFRLSRSQAATEDQDHDYLPEQLAVDKGLMDLFPMSLGAAGPAPSAPPAAVTTKGLTMGYYDGNTVTALWNYAQHFAMSDNSYGTTFGLHSRRTKSDFGTDEWRNQHAQRLG